MAPGRPAAAAAEASPEPLEVRCAGCGETLEVEPGLTEFICPDCAMPQSLPPELMPPPPPRRKALPLPRGAADVRGARLPCGACGALLSVPVGLARCACPICGAELAVDTERLRHYLLSSAAVEGAIPVVPIGASSSPPILQVREVHEEHPNVVSRTGLIQAEPNNQLNCMGQAQTKRPNQLILEQTEPYHHSDCMIDGEGIHEANEIITRYHKQRNRESIGHGIITAEKRQEKPLNKFRHQAQDQHSSYALCTKKTHLDRRDRVNEAHADAIDPTVFSESGCIALINETNTTRINCTTVLSVGPKPINIDKNHSQAPNPKQIIQKQPTYIAISSENAQDKDADGAIHVREKQRGTVNQANHTQEACTQLDNQIVAGHSSRTVRCSEKEQSEPFSSTIRKRKVKSLVANSSSGLELRRSKRLAKDSPAAKDKEHDKNKFFELQVSQNDQVSPLVMDTESIHRDLVESQAASSTGHMAAAITDSEPSESEPDDLYEPSPDQGLSNSPDIDRIINICPSSSPRHEIPEKGSDDFDNFQLTTPPHSSHIDMSDPECFARNYIPEEVRKALGKLRSKSLFENVMSQASSGDVHVLTDSEEHDEPWTMAHQNVGTKRNQGRGRGLTLCLKVWILPKDVRIPVLLNASGEPIGKEAGTLSSFLGALARDGILSPLTHQDWRRVPEKNKDVMYHIVKLKFDIAPVAEFWILKCIGKKWKSWKALLKQKHYDMHETVEECLADRNPRVLKEQWQYLVAYWGTEKAKAASSRNKACRANVTATHTAGTKSFARIIEEEKQKRPNNEEPTPADLFILTHTHKNGKPMKKEKADIIARVREQSHKHAECSGSDSTSHNVGLESCSIGRRGKRGRRKAVLQASFKEAEAAKRKAEDEAAMLRKKMMAMEESEKKLQEDLANMKSTVSAMQNTTSTGDLSDGQTQNFPNETTGVRSTIPGLPQVQNAPGSHEILQPYLDYSALYDPSASPDPRFR